ncbi:MAG TPA: spermidine/putrescine ABC transporter substrate-binding protein [Verrucomicrobiales bacterium]|nr:spermidine/putrescine ABC transporter substrate-binding protein [Verrucomicrobiales bacterium]
MRILKGIIYIAIAAILFGCNKNTKTSNKAEDSLNNVVKMLCWSEYFDPSAIEKFTNETGIDVEYITYDDPDEVEARLVSEPGRFDVVVTDDLAINILAKLRLLQLLDKSALPNFENVSSEYLRKKFDIENNYSVPYLWGTTLIAYRSDKIDSPEKSWKSLWDKKYKGKVMVLGDRTEGLGIGMISQGNPINSSDPRHIQSASEIIVEGIKNGGVRLGSDAEIREGLLSGDVWIASCYSGDAAMISEENENISFFIPSEGAPLWMDNFSVASDATNVNGAYLFIDYMLRKESAAMNANFTWYGTTNSAAVPLLDEELLADETINPPEEMRSLCQFYYVPDTNRDLLLNEAWSKVVDALRTKSKNGLDVEVAGSVED